MEMYRKIGKGEVKFPKWFALEVRRLLSRILDPNLKTRISMAKIMENSWFKKGLEKPIVIDIGKNELASLHTDGVFEVSKNSSDSNTESIQQQTKPCNNLNAFDIISFSSGFDLSSLFEDTIQKKEMRFTSNKPASIIISKFEEICKCLRLKITKKDGGLLKLESSKEGRKGTLNIDAEIFEITPLFHLVELKKSEGDTVEYQKLLQQEIRPALKDIVWNWQGEKPQELQHEAVLEEQPTTISY
jgi:5'-AMP-activated protein kinase catalytic alpha subunit